MDSDNPFIQRIHTEDEELENYEEITDEDVAKYLLRGQTMKFSNPDQFVFIYLPVDFIGFKVEENKVKSLLLYLNETEEVYDTLVTAFGPADLSMEVEGQVEDRDAAPDRQRYSSYTWVQTPYRLTFSIVPVMEKDGKPVLKSQLYITQ